MDFILNKQTDNHTKHSTLANKNDRKENSYFFLLLLTCFDALFTCFVISTSFPIDKTIELAKAYITARVSTGLKYVLIDISITVRYCMNW